MKVAEEPVILWICWGRKNQPCHAYKYTDESEWNHGDENERKGQVIDALAIKMLVHHGFCPRHD